MTVGDYYVLAYIGVGAFLCIVGAIAIANKMGIAGRFSAKVPWLGEISAPASSMILVAGIFVLIVPPHLNPQLFVINDKNISKTPIDPSTAQGREDYTTALILDSYWFLPESIENVGAAEQWASVNYSMFGIAPVEGAGGLDVFISEYLAKRALPVSSNCGRAESEWFRDGEEVLNPCPEACDGGMPIAENFRLNGYPPHLQKKLTFQCYLTRDDLQIPVQSLREALQGDPEP